VKDILAFNTTDIRERKWLQDLKETNCEKISPIDSSSPEEKNSKLSAKIPHDIG